MKTNTMFLIIILAGAFVSSAHAADEEQVTLTGSVPAPQGIYNRLVFEKAWDYDRDHGGDGLTYSDTDDWYVDPNWWSRLRFLKIYDLTVEHDLFVGHDATINGKTTSHGGFFGPFFEDTDPLMRETTRRYLRVDPSGTSEFVTVRGSSITAGATFVGELPPAPSLTSLSATDLRRPVYDTDWIWTRGNFAREDVQEDANPLVISDAVDLYGQLDIHNRITNDTLSDLDPGTRGWEVLIEDPQGLRVEGEDIRLQVGYGRWFGVTKGVTIEGNPEDHTLLRVQSTETPRSTAYPPETAVFGDGYRESWEEVRAEELVVGAGVGWIGPPAEPETATYGGITLGRVRRTSWPKEVACNWTGDKSWTVIGGGRITATCSNAVITRMNFGP